jgi:hypothetical protein
MPASKKTVDDVADIMIKHVGVLVAKRMVAEIQSKTTGNQSYSATINALLQVIKDRHRTQNNTRSANAR